MKIFKSITEWQQYRRKIADTVSIGFAPTLGGLHEGHFSLIRESLKRNDLTVASIFLNRVQFNNPEDYKKYPADFAEDIAHLETLGVDALLAPDFEDMYPDSYAYRVAESDLSAEREGAHRPGHFDGVLTIVLKLLNLVRPSRAYFGEKDYQQLQLVDGMAKAFFLETQIVPCPTVRDESGIALSSRNRRLSEWGRERAARFPEILSRAETAEEAIALLGDSGFEVDYVEDHGGRRFGAVVIEGIRLIDNMKIGFELPVLETERGRG